MFDLPRMNPRVIEFFLTPLLAEVFSLVIFLLLTSLVSCRAIAKDRETHALEIYWTRGIGPRGYFFGKWLGSVLLVGTVFVAAPAIVWLFGVLMAPGWDLFHETIVFIPRLLLGLSLFTAVLTYIAVSFSAIATTANFASILWFFLLLGSAAMVRLLAFRLFQGEWWIKAVDPWDAGKRLVEWICGVAPQQSYSPWVALVSLATVVAVVTLLMLRRLRLNEAVG